MIMKYSIFLFSICFVLTSCVDLSNQIKRIGWHYGAGFYNNTDIELYVLFDLDRNLSDGDLIKHCEPRGYCSISSGSKKIWEIIKDSSYVYCIDAKKWHKEESINELTPDATIAIITWKSIHAFRQDSLTLPAKDGFPVKYNEDYYDELGIAR